MVCWLQQLEKRSKMSGRLCVTNSTGTSIVRLQQQVTESVRRKIEQVHHKSLNISGNKVRLVKSGKV